MDESLLEQLGGLTGPHLADGCLRCGVPIRFAPAGVQPLAPGMRCHGRALPVRHVGSIDVFMEALDHAQSGDVMVIDNGGRSDEACIGDIVLLEAMAAGIAGFVIWGLHRDSAELREIGLPVFSMGALPPARSACTRARPTCSSAPASARTRSRAKTSWWPTTMACCSCRKPNGSPSWKRPRPTATPKRGS